MTAPIAIVSRSCVFPKSLSPQALWKNLLESRDLLSPPDHGRWGVAPAAAMECEGWNNPAGYVTGFEDIFDVEAYPFEREWLAGLDPLFHWVLHTSKEAYRQINRADQGDLCVLLGNLSLPTQGLAKWTESVWAGGDFPQPLNRYMSGLPAHLVLKALQRRGDAAALDAACASSIYAIKLGCEKLRRKDCDIVLAGAVNRADPLFLHIGFQALQALSPSGRSRPFHRDADGLVPTEGAAFIGLKRLDDAIDCGDDILAVVHDAGLSNDGRSDGLLVPAGEGQVRSIRRAYDGISIEPEEVSFIECHATGTPVGDGREVLSLAEAFEPTQAIPIGSHKSNMGHSITAAGMAGLLKILGAIEHGTIPPTIHCDDPIDELEETAFRLVTKAEPWRAERKIAALSAFGFGGNNSHLVVEEWSGDRDLFGGADLVCETPEVAVVGMGICSGVAGDVAEFQTFLVGGKEAPLRDANPLQEVELLLEELRFPPRDLEESLPQQLAILRAACDAVDQAGGESVLRRETTGVVAGMQTDPDIVRHGLRARFSGDRQTQDRIAEPLTAAAVVGALPNIVANRINSHFDLGGMSFATSAEEQSGEVALREACLAIARGDLEAAIVGAVEMACTEAHRAALRHESKGGTDAAVALVIKDLDSAMEAGDEILATIADPGRCTSDEVGVSIEMPRAHSAMGLLQIAAAIAVPEWALPRVGEAAGIRADTVVRTEALQADARTTKVTRSARPVLVERPRIYSVCVADRRAAIVAATEEELEAKKARFRSHIECGDAPGEGVFIEREPLDGEVAQVFTGAAAAYHGMGRSLCLAVPELVTSLARDFKGLEKATRWMFHPDPKTPAGPLDKLFASSVLSQIHSEFSSTLLGVNYDAAIGFSSGETNALFATGVWRDFDGLMEDFVDSEAFTTHLGGQFEVLRRRWAEHLEPGEAPRWESWRVKGPRHQLEAAIADEPMVYLILINAPDDVAIGGHRSAIERVLQTLEGFQTSYLDYDIAVHLPELADFEASWTDIHSRTTHPCDVRLYSHGFGTHYEPTRQRVAQALLEQALRPVDFPSLIRAAYDDGVRVFVEHGPRTTLGPWIRKSLADRPHRVISLDSGSDDSLRPVANAVAKLAMCGVEVDLEAFNELMERGQRRNRRASSKTIRFSARRWTPKLTSAAESADVTVLPEAPALPRVTDLTMHQPTQRQAPAGESAPMRGDANPSQLPEYFHLQRQAFERYLDVVAAGADVHRVFMERSQRAWNLDRRPADGAAGMREVDEAGQPLFTRADLEVHAAGDISTIFGPIFERQRDYPRQVRMPQPPLLLADRVMDIDAEPGVVSTGTVWTETDVEPDDWYLFNGYMPPGIMIEAGQADLLLISWMGADFENKGQRIYRLLGCELTYRGGLASVGDTLKYDIHIDDHATQGDVRLFFFHYDCRIDGDVRLSVRHGQAGFFTDEELQNSMGVLWAPEDADFRDDVRLDPPRVPREAIPERLDARSVQSFANGNVGACFGTGYERLHCHTRTPNIEQGQMCLIGSVEALDIEGGPAGRGYMRTRYAIADDRWFFDGHFKDDPCMPGTLMFEGGMQVMSLYMIALGATLDRDGWRFEPVPDVAFPLRCRGQATPSNGELIYEIYVEEFVDGPQPRLVADILATVDGRKAFHCRGMQMHLVPDTPLTQTLLVEGMPSRDERALRQGELVHDELALRATGIGPAALCMGDRYAAHFDGPRRMPRLPGEPFQFMSRVVAADGRPGEPGPMPTAVVEYDIPESAWYFDSAGGAAMPSAVMMEAALQPCGWLSLYSGAVLESEEPLYYRNLDGSATLYRELGPGDGTLVTETVLTRNSSSGAMTIQSFELQCRIGDELVYEMETTFGFFPRQALQDQVGLPADDDMRARIDADSDFEVLLPTDLEPAQQVLWPDKTLCMIDAVTGRWNTSNGARFRAEKAISAEEWFFKAHFYQDPVMPGSLGVEAMLQTLRFAMLDEGYQDRFRAPYIEPVATAEMIRWSYRGQVPPESQGLTILLDLHEVEEQSEQTIGRASASLWVDGLKIYAADELAMRIREAPEK